MSINHLGKPDYEGQIGQLAKRVASLESRFAAIETLQASFANRISLLEGGTPTPAPLPSFTSAPVVSPGSGQVGQSFTVAYVAANATSAAIQWLLNGTAISGANGASYVSAAAGTLTSRVTLTGPGGTVTATSTGVTVSAIPAPVFTTQPSISPTSGTTGQTFTASDGVASNANSYARRWLLSGTQIGTGTTVSPSSAGSLVLEVTATGPGGSTVTTSAAVTVTAAATAPAAPTLAATPGAAQNSITFTDGANGGSAITSRKLYRSTTSGFPPSSGNLIATNPTFPYVDTGLTNGTTYYSKGIATNAVGDSAASAQVSGTPAAASTPAGALTVGTTSRKATMQPGDVVAPVSGSFADSLVAMTGAAYDAGFLDVNEDGTAIVVGVNGPGVLGDTTGTYSLVHDRTGYTRQVSGPFPSITTTQDYFPVTSTNAIARSANANLQPSRPAGTVDQVIAVAFFSVRDIPATSRSRFGLLASDGTSIPPEWRINTTTGNVSFRANNNSYSTTLGVAQVGKFQQAIVQMNMTNGHGTAVGDRVRGWLDGEPQVSQTMGTAVVIPDNRFFGVQTATASLAISERTGFDWMWWGSSAECPKIDFDLPANRAAFNIENLNPTTGTVTLTDMSGNPVTLTPKLFFHGDVAARDAGLVNKGTLETAVTLTKVAGTYAASDFSSNTIVIGDPTQRSVTSMTENDITWTPASALTAMQLEDGGWMVANPSGVGITASPPARQRDRNYPGDSAADPPYAAGTTGMQWTDGMGLNVGSQAAVDIAPSGNAPYDGSQQPFDSWATQYDSSQLPYSAALNIDPGRTGTPVTITQGILTKQRSMDVVRRDAQFTAASVSDLVVVPTLPASGTLLFRPPTALPAVDLFIPADNASLDLSAFPNLSPTGLGAPQFFQVYNKLKLLHTTWHLNRGTARNTSPRAHEENYGKEYAYWTGAAVLLMCLSSTTTAQKQALARALSRIGIQYTGMYEAGRRSTGSGLGGTSQGRKITLAVAAIVTGNARVLAASQAEGWLAEQRQITTITQANVDRATDPYPAAFLGRGEWTSSPVTEEGYPRATWADQRVKYRHLWMNTMFSHYVAMKVIPALATAANWPAFLDYGKRYYDTENGTIAKTDGTGTYGAGTFPGDGSHTLNGPLAAFAKNMRTTFPSYFA